MNTKSYNLDKPSKIISKCVPGISLPTITHMVFPSSFQPIQVGTISLDLSSFCDPKVLLTFSGEMIANTTLLSGHFRIMRTCNGVTTQVSNNLGGLFTLFATETFAYQCVIVVVTVMNVTALPILLNY